MKSELLISAMENAYGIKKLRVNLDSEKKMFQELIYSKNGTFKTSFARTMYEVNNGTPENVYDRLTGMQGLLNIAILKGGVLDNSLINKFIVFSRDIYESNEKLISDYNNEIETLTLDKKNSEYIKELINEETLEVKISIDTYLKGTGHSFESVLTAYTNPKLGYLDKVIELLEILNSYESKDISEINVKKIFQKAYDIIDDANFQQKVSNYINVIKSKINAELFDEDFNEANCLSFVSTIEKSKFLNKEKRRGLSINDTTYFDVDSIKKIFDEEIKKISNDADVIEQSNEVSKAMGTSKEAIVLKSSIVSNPLLISQLSIGREEILLSYLKNSNIDFEHWLKNALNVKKELDRLLKLSINKKTDFEKAIEIYKNRFAPIFDVKVINKVESLLGLEVPMITFYHKRNPNTKIEEKNLKSILSSGEKTTLNILKFIVEYETNKSNNNFIILDDIVETFDYANRYAFIEYINDLVKNNTPIIVLTHNFEFFNTLSKRIPALRKCVVKADESGVVDIQINNRIGRKMESILICNNEQSFFAAIPYLREAKYILHEDVCCLDSCLHYKGDTKNVKICDILALFPKDCISNLIINDKELFFDKLKKLADEVSNMDNYDIVKKTILALSCRLTIEEKIIGERFELINEITENQTAYILDKYKMELNSEIIKILEKVQLSTPEFIHGNSFMYEPLIDIDGTYLQELYNEIKKINNSSIWKK